LIDADRKSHSTVTKGSVASLGQNVGETLIPLEFFRTAFARFFEFFVLEMVFAFVDALERCLA
jgi:hypothetical protein